MINFDDTPALGPFDLSFLDGFQWCDLNLQLFATDQENEQ